MTLKEFDEFLIDKIFSRIQEILNTKSGDYSADNDKLYNFKLQSRIDGITPIEALRGNQLKHRASICQGLDELQQGRIRSASWWFEKIIDDINYNILLLALLEEEFDD